MNNEASLTEQKPIISLASIKLSPHNSFDGEQTNTALMLKGEIDQKSQKKAALTTNPKQTEDIR